MKCLIFTNGDYGSLELYRPQLLDKDIILCADGGANYAYKLGLIPDYIIGDMDSIDDKVRDYYIEKNVIFKKFPREKDFTDTQLTINMAEELGVTDIILFGSTGSRFDHTLSNLYSSMKASQNSIKIRHYAPDWTIHVVSGQLELFGKIGETVSTLALTDIITGLRQRGVKYPLEDVLLEKNNPFAISNYLVKEKAEIELATGVIAVIHYHDSENNKEL